ncbi:hypothetical protein [Baekduia sp. Peel2402]|uniref:hypothetical protein n=1 Tax=Baekduia sp. Peel2402 TaxID=3458296 RepID=UPI00403EC985
MRSRAATALATAALIGAAALGAPAATAANVAPEATQYVTPWPVYAHDATYDLQPNTTQTFRLDLPELDRPHTLLVPCWGFEVVGPGVDLAAADLRGYGWIAAPDADERLLHPNPSAELRDGGWYLPESRAVVDLPMLGAGANCRQLGWSLFVGPGAGIASAAEVRRARRTKRVVPIRHPRRSVRARPANTYNDGSVQVPLAGTRYARHRRGGLQIVVRVVTGPLAGATTITLHGRVLVTR